MAVLRFLCAHVQRHIGAAGKICMVSNSFGSIWCSAGNLEFGSHSRNISPAMTVKAFGIQGVLMIEDSARHCI